MGLELKTDDNPTGDIDIQYTGLRPGEKLYEGEILRDFIKRLERVRLSILRVLILPMRRRLILRLL